MTPEEKAIKAYPDPEPFTDTFGFKFAQSIVYDKRCAYVNGWNDCKEEMDKEIAEINNMISIYESSCKVFDSLIEKSDKEIAALKDEILSLKVPFSTNPQINPPQ